MNLEEARGVTDDEYREYRVDDLARLSGMTVRNIREHQSRGLLPAPPVRALKAATEARTHVQAVAKCFVQLYMDQIWAPFEAAGYPADAWPEILSGLDRLRPLALDSVLALMRMALDEAAATVIEERA